MLLAIVSSNRSLLLINSVFSSKLLPVFIGRVFLATTDSSANSLCFVCLLSFLLRFPITFLNLGRGLFSPFLSSFLTVPHYFFLVQFREHNESSLGNFHTPCKRPHPQPQHKFDQVLGIMFYCTFALLHCRNRFAFAVCHLLPITSFRLGIATNALVSRIVFLLVR